MTIEFNDIAYRSSHGTKPKGRGAWAFAYSRNPSREDTILWTPSMTYTEAKKHIKAQLKQKALRDNLWVVASL